MTRLALAIAGTAFLCTVPTGTVAGGRFDTKLPKDQQELQVLSRLTFGPRPGDVEEIRLLGVEKWVDLQLHPERIPENPLLEKKLKLLETLRMEPSEIMRAYPQTPPALMSPQFTPLNELLSQDQIRQILNSTAEERRAALDALTPEKRKQVLTVIPTQQLTGLPDVQKESEAVRQEQQQERQKQIRMLMPPLNELLTPDQLQTALRGNKEQLEELFSFLDPVKRKQVAAALPPQALAQLPDYRRMGLN